MKSMIALSVLFITTTIVSCKKGEEDPFFTLASRKARISGEWKMTGYSEEWTSMYDGGTISTGTQTGDENSLIRSWTLYSEQREEVTTIFEYSYTIDRDGTWESVIEGHFVNTVEDDYMVSVTTGYSRTESSGTWAFVGKTKDVYKNKERVNFVTLSKYISWQPSETVTDYKDPFVANTVDTNPGGSHSQNFTHGESVTTYEILMLKSKEMKWVQDTDNSNTYNDGSYSYSGAAQGSKEITWTLK